MKFKILIGLSVLFIVSCGPGSGNEDFKKNNMKFPESLSAFRLFKGDMKELVPLENVQVLHLSSTLFTDYTEKQRLVKLPPGTKMVSRGDGLPEFPDGAILAKTFYYSPVQTSGRQKIIETRILQKYKGLWNVATYKWNEEQTDAILTNDGGTVNVTITTSLGEKKDINYKIPTVQQCYDCHKSKEELTPIGPKLRNLNMDVLIGGNSVSQLRYLDTKGLLTIKGHESISSLPAYTDSSLPIQKRARAYFEMNCAHCHNPDGLASMYSLDLRYENAYEHTGILFNKWNIKHRMTIKDMPKLGTTVVDKKGLKLIEDYLATLKD